MRTVGVWASGLLASAIPFVFVGAVIAFSAFVFDAQRAPPARSRASFQAESATLERILAVASADAPDDVGRRQPGKHAHGDADARRHPHAPSRRSRFHAPVRHSPFELGFGSLRAAFANQWDRARVQ
jgi:hypothetical protein